MAADTIPTRRDSQFRRNMPANMANFAVNVLLGLWFTPYLVRHLGIAAYGLIPLAMAVTSYLGLLTLSLNGAVGRYLTIALERHDDGEANRIFNTTLFGGLGVVLVLFPVVLWLTPRAHWFFRVPSGYERQFGWLFLCTIGMFMLTEVATAFSLSTFCRNRLDLSNAVLITANLVRVGTVVVLFTGTTPQVWHVGAGLLSSGLVILLGGMIFWRVLTPGLRLRPLSFSLPTLRHLVGTGGWMVVNQIGVLLYLSIDLIVVNRLLGSEAGGRYGAIMQWSTLLRGLGAALAGVFAPTIIALYAHNDIAGLVRYARQAVKFTGLVLALPIGLVCGLARPLLQLWLGPDFASLAPLLSLMTIHLCANLCILPLFYVQTATNHVRLPGILTCVLGLMNLGLALLLAGPVGWGMYGVAAAGAIMITAKNLLFTPLYGAHILGLHPLTFFRETIPVIVVTVAVALGGQVLDHLWALQSWPALVGSGCVLGLAYVAVSYGVLLSRSERVGVLALLGPHPRSEAGAMAVVGAEGDKP